MSVLLFFIKVPKTVVKEEEDPPVQRSFWYDMDILGSGLLAIASILLLFGLHFGGNQLPWGSPPVVALFSGAVFALVAFILVEHCMGNDATLPLTMIRQRGVAFSFLLMTFSVAATCCATYFLPVYFQAVMGVAPIMSGVYLLPMIISQLVGAVISGWLGRCLPFPPLSA